MGNSKSSIKKRGKELLEASKTGKVELVKRKLAKGTDTEANSKDDFKYTPLIYASCFDHVEVVKQLIAAGANIEAKTKFRQTSLILACIYGHLNTVKYLIGKGANIESKDHLGQTPLIKASAYGHLEVVKLLISKGANIEAKDDAGLTSLNIASINCNLEVVKELLREGANTKGSHIYKCRYNNDKKRKEIVKLLNIQSVYLSFDESNQETTDEMMKRIDENQQIRKVDSIDKSNIVIFFLTKKFIESDKFKRDLREKENKFILIVLLENIESLLNLDLNRFFVSLFNASMSSIEKEEVILRNKRFMSRLNSFKNNSKNEIPIAERNLNESKKKFLNGIDGVLEKLENIGHNKIIAKLVQKYHIIVIINWKKAKTIGKIENIQTHDWNTGEQEFCYINHLNQIFVYQQIRSKSTQLGEDKFSLFTLTGTWVRPVYSHQKDLYKLNSINYDKITRQLYLNVFNTWRSIRQFLVLSEHFNLIRIIDNDLTNPEFPFNNASEIDIFHVPYRVFHYDSNYAFLQSEANQIYIFDKSSYCFVATIGNMTSEMIVMILNNKLVFKDLNGCFSIKTIKHLKPASQVDEAFCRFNNPFKQPHLLSNPYLFICGHSACLDCIHQNYNIFKKNIKCLVCEKLHRLPQQLESMDKSTMSELLNKDLFIFLIDKNKKLVHDFEELWECYENKFDYIANEIEVKIESLKAEVENKGDELINKINKFIQNDSLNREKLFKTIKRRKFNETRNSVFNIFKKFKKASRKDFERYLDEKIGLINNNNNHDDDPNSKSCFDDTENYDEIDFADTFIFDDTCSFNKNQNELIEKFIQNLCNYLELNDDA